MTERTRTAVLMPNWLGDFVMALTVVHQKLPIIPDLTLIVPAHLVSVAEALGNQRIIPYKRASRQEYRASLQQIEAEKFDQVYILPPSFSSALLCFRARIPQRHGLTGDWRRILLTHPVQRDKYNRQNHITKAYGAVMECEIKEPGHWKQVQEKPECPRQFRDVIVLCPGARYGPAKKWPYWKELIEELPAETPICILGDKNDAPDIDSMVAGTGKNVFNLAGKTSLTEAMGIIASARHVVSNDSGLMHIAGFFNVPLTAIFGSTSPEWTRPVGTKATILTTRYSCSPCFKRTCRFNHYNCLKTITAYRVYETLTVR